MAVNVAWNYVPVVTQWASTAAGVNVPALRQVAARHDKRADVLSIRLRDGDPKYVVVGRGTFVLYADEGGIWAVDLEAERWDVDTDEAFTSAGVEIW